MNLPNLKKLQMATCQFYQALCDLENFPQAWLDGFQNAVCYGQNASDDDNSYLSDFEPVAYRNYKNGALAAISLFEAKPEI